VLPTDGLHVRAQHSTRASIVGTFREGTLVQGSARADVDGTQWIFVREVYVQPIDGHDEVVGTGSRGWVEARLLELHPEGAEDPAGRYDPMLAREGFKAVTVLSGDTLAQIAKDSRVDTQDLLDLVERYILNPNEIFPGDTLYLPGRPG
jgi:hypothetical protein